MEAVSEPVTCESCKAVGQRGLRYPAPPGWYYLIARDENEHIEGDFYVYACSIACRQALWKQGPGAPFPEGDRAIQLLRGSHADGVPRRPVSVIAAASPPPKCTCGHAREYHGVNGCTIQIPGAGWCPCCWTPTPLSEPIACGVRVVHTAKNLTGFVERVGNATYTVLWDDGTWNIVPQADVRRLG
jgi:hypothetical protein